MSKLPFIFVIFCVLYNEVRNQMETNPTYQNFGQYIPSESQPKATPYPYYGGINPFPYYQSQYSNNYPNYAPNSYPGNYDPRYYPSLYQEFLNGLYSYPGTSSFGSNTVPSSTNGILANYAANNNPQYSEGVKRDTASEQMTGHYIPNYTNLGQQKAYVRNVEVEPVSTLLTSYRGSDGKTYLRLVTSYSDGKEKETDVEYNSKLHLRITNGVVEPNNFGDNFQPETIDNTNTLENTRNDNIDPNSIIQQLEQRNGYGVEDETEREKPADVNSWYSYGII